MKNKTLKFKRMKTHVIAVFLLTGILASCGGEKPVQKRIVQELQSTEILVTNRQFELGEMELGTLSLHDFHRNIKANGMLDVPPGNKVTVSVYFGGYVKDIQLLPGQKVSKGQKLFVLENPDYVQVQQDFLEAKSRLSYLKQDFERQKTLAVDHVSSQKTYSKAESDYKMVYAQFESLKKKLSLMNIDPSKITETNLRSAVTITAPISGYVTAIPISKGMFLNPSDVAVTITNGSIIHVELMVFEQDLNAIEIGQEVRFRLQKDDQEYRAVVHLINKAIDPLKRTINVHCDLKTGSQSPLFIPGMYVEAEIETIRNRSLALPASAVVNAGKASYALILKKKSGKDYLFEKKVVKAGESNNGYIEVLNATEFDPNTSFLTSGAFNLIKD
jgi:cobalt-zinc-cadmium efflux system membrane fusion protein